MGETVEVKIETDKVNKTPEYTLKAIKRYLEKNKVKIAEYKKQYQNKNKESLNEYNKKYAQMKRDTDPELKKKQNEYSKAYYYRKKAAMQQIVNDLT